MPIQQDNRDWRIEPQYLTHGSNIRCARPASVLVAGSLQSLPLSAVDCMPLPNATEKTVVRLSSPFLRPRRIHPYPCAGECKPGWLRSSEKSQRGCICSELDFCSSKINICVGTSQETRDWCNTSTRTKFRRKQDPS